MFAELRELLRSGAIRRHQLGEIMKKHTNDFEHDAIPQLVLRLAIPTMLAQLVSVLYSIVDRIDRKSTRLNSSHII